MEANYCKQSDLSQSIQCPSPLLGEAYPSLALPKPNPYIATDFALIERGVAMNEPSLLEQCPKYNLWYMQDHEFETPTAIM